MAANRYQRSDRAPYVYRTHDYGEDVDEDRQRRPGGRFRARDQGGSEAKGLLFLGTETGIYVSFDDGDHWQSFSLDLPVTPVHGITVKNDDLVIARTAAASTCMDNITCCGRSAATTTDAARRALQARRRDASVSRGVAIDYFLKQPADKVTIEFLDAQGKLIRDVHRRADACQGGRRRRSRRRATRTSAVRRRHASAIKQGLNRFVWDMRYPDATDFKGLIMWAGSIRGPARRRAVPGAADRGGSDEDAAVRHRAQSAGARDRTRICRSSSRWQARSATRCRPPTTRSSGSAT